MLPLLEEVLFLLPSFSPTPALVAFTLNLAGTLFSHGTKFGALNVLPVLL